MGSPDSQVQRRGQEETAQSLLTCFSGEGEGVRAKNDKSPVIDWALDVSGIRDSDPRPRAWENGFRNARQ